MSWRTARHSAVPSGIASRRRSAARHSASTCPAVYTTGAASVGAPTGSSDATNRTSSIGVIPNFTRHARPVGPPEPSLRHRCQGSARGTLPLLAEGGLGHGSGGSGENAPGGSATSSSCVTPSISRASGFASAVEPSAFRIMVGSVNGDSPGDGSGSSWRRGDGPRSDDIIVGCRRTAAMALVSVGLRSAPGWASAWAWAPEMASESGSGSA